MNKFPSALLFAALVVLSADAAAASQTKSISLSMLIESLAASVPGLALVSPTLARQALISLSRSCTQSGGTTSGDCCRRFRR